MNNTIDLMNDIANAMRKGDLDMLWMIQLAVENWIVGSDEKDAMENLIQTAIMMVEENEADIVINK